MKMSHLKHHFCEVPTVERCNQFKAYRSQVCNATKTSKIKSCAAQICNLALNGGITV